LPWRSPHWLRVPESWKIIVRGSFPKGVYAKDFMLHFIGTVKADGAAYKALEFTGPAMDSLSMPDGCACPIWRLSAGLKWVYSMSDEVTRKFLERLWQGRRLHSPAR